MKLFLLAVVVVAACGCSNPGSLPDPKRIGAPDHSYAVVDRPSCDPEVWAAVEKRDAAALIDLIRRGVKISCGDGSDDETPLDRAVMADSPAMVRTLLDAGANPNWRWGQHGDRFPLQETIEASSYVWPLKNRAEIVRLLLQHGSDPNARWCPFESRASSQTADGCLSDTGITPLMMAATRGQADVVGQLLAAGADAGLMDDEKRVALEYASDEDSYGLILTLTKPGKTEGEAGAAEDFKRRQLTTSAPREWQSVLGEAINRHSYGQARLALAAGADASPALASAIWFRWPAAVDLLLKSGADPNRRSCPPSTYDRHGKFVPPPKECQSENGLTPLMVAASLGDGESIRLLMIREADTDARDWMGRTAADHARAVGRPDLFPAAVPVR